MRRISLGGAAATPRVAEIPTPRRQLRFAPKLKPEAGGTPLGDGNTRKSLSSGGALGNDVDFAATLKHSLALRNAQMGGKRHTDQFVRAAAPGAAAGMGSRQMAAQAASLNAQQKAQQHLANIRAKKQLDGQRKKELTLLELSFIQSRDGGRLYNPVSLPYIAKVSDLVQQADQDPQLPTCSIASKRPSAKLIDEANRRAANLFTPAAETGDEDDSARSHQWFLVQLPALLPPFTRTVNNSDNRFSTEAGATNTSCSRFEELPEGKLGQLLIRKSGKVELRLGNNFVFDVNQGSDCSFNQEVACLVGDGSELILLGNCEKRVVFTPRI